MLVAALVMSLAACNSDPTAAGPTGDVEKDAKAVVEKVTQLINDLDVTDLTSMKKLEDEMKALQEKYDKFYEAKGEDVKKQFDEACEKASKDAKLDELMEKKAKEMQEKLGIS